MTPNAPMTAPPAPLPPNGDMARTHLITAAESLRVASERLCDYVEATMGETTDAQSDECSACRHLRAEHDSEGGCWHDNCPCVLFVTTAPTVSPSPTPPPIPLGAVVEALDFHWEWQEKGAWAAGEITAANGSTLDVLLTAFYHARREREEAQRECARADGYIAVAQSEREAAWEAREKAIRERDEARSIADRYAAHVKSLERERNDAERERDAARREREEVQDQGLGATAPNSEGLTARDAATVQCATSPAPASAPLSETAPLSGAGNTGETGKPRRWWLRRRGDAGWPDAHAYHSEEVARSALYGPTGDGWREVVPVIEARVTRETVERVADAMRNGACGSSVWEVFCSEARAALSALGLTVEGDDNA